MKFFERMQRRNVPSSNAETERPADPSPRQHSESEDPRIALWFEEGALQVDHELAEVKLRIAIRRKERFDAMNAIGGDAGDKGLVEHELIEAQKTFNRVNGQLTDIKARLARLKTSESI